MAKVPADRFPTAVAFADALEAEPPTVATPVPGPTRASRWLGGGSGLPRCWSCWPPARSSAASGPALSPPLPIRSGSWSPISRGRPTTARSRSRAGGGDRGAGRVEHRHDAPPAARRRDARRRPGRHHAAHRRRGARARRPQLGPRGPRRQRTAGLARPLLDRAPRHRGRQQPHDPHRDPRRHRCRPGAGGAGAAREVRERLGERRSDIQADRALVQVATPSFAAYRLYVEARQISIRGDLPAGNRLLREAIALDTGFASAWASLALNHLTMRNAGIRPRRPWPRRCDGPTASATSSAIASRPKPPTPFATTFRQPCTGTT